MSHKPKLNSDQIVTINVTAVNSPGSGLSVSAYPNTVLMSLENQSQDTREDVILWQFHDNCNGCNELYRFEISFISGNPFDGKASYKSPYESNNGVVQAQTLDTTLLPDDETKIRIYPYIIYVFKRKSNTATLGQDSVMLSAGMSDESENDSDEPVGHVFATAIGRRRGWGKGR